MFANFSTFPEIQCVWCTLPKIKVQARKKHSPKVGLKYNKIVSVKSLSLPISNRGFHGYFLICLHFQALQAHAAAEAAVKAQQAQGPGLVGPSGNIGASGLCGPSGCVAFGK